MRTPHTCTFKGKTVFVKLKNGDQFEDKFKDKKQKFVFFERVGKVPIIEIRSFSIRKLKSKQ
jgi:hypothetical protein